MIGLSVVNSASKSWSERPCGCSLDGCSFIRLTTLMTRTFRSGACLRRRSTAARVSKVGTSPQQAITTSGSPPRSLLAHSQMPRPAWQCLTASSIVSGREMVVPRISLRDPGTVGHLKYILPAVRVVFVRTEEPEISFLHVQLHHIA